MRIALNLLYLIPGEVGGTEVYARSLIRALSLVDRQNEYVIFHSIEAASIEWPASPNFKQILCPIPARYRWLRYAWEQLVFPIQLRFHRIDLVHSLGYVGPLDVPCRSVVTVHDLNYVALKGLIPEFKRRVLEFFSTRSARRADLVITDSYYSQEQIISHLSIQPDQVITIHLGPGWDFDQVTPWNEVRDLYEITYPYIVAIGGNSHHKNISRLVEAYYRIYQQIPHRLILIGHLHPDVRLDYYADARFEKPVKLLGYVPQPFLFPVIQHADLFIMPSLYEGFGLPILEAQKGGAVVACSTSCSLPEVAGDGALFFNPESIDEMAAAIVRCVLDKPLRQRLIHSGANNLKRFSWEKTAVETLAAYEAVIAS